MSALEASAPASNVVELGRPVTLALPHALHAQIAEAARGTGAALEDEIVARLHRSFQRRRASDAMDEFLAAACRPTDAG